MLKTGPVRMNSPDVYEFGAFRVDAIERLCWREGQSVSITGKTFDVLLLLLRRAGHLVEKPELLSEVWKDTCVEDGNIAVTISMLRKALGDNGKEEHYIQTVAKRGYRFVLPVRTIRVTQVEQATDFQQKPGSIEMAAAASSLRIENRLSNLKRSPIRVALVPGVLFILCFALVLFIRTPGTRAGGQRVRSIAVLPFRGLGVNSSSSVGLAIADAVIVDLDASGEVDVRPTSAVQRYAELDTDPIAVGRVQKVDAILAGTVDGRPDGLHVEARLLRVADSSVLWSAHFDQAPASSFGGDVANQIVGSVAKRLGLHLRATQRQQNARAYQLYMQGRYFWNKRTEDGLRRSIEYFQQATLEDSQYAAAYAGLADSYALLSSYGVESAEQAYPNAKAAAYKALKLNPSLGEAYTSLGMVSFYYEWNWIEAERQFQRSIALNPNYPLAHTWYALELAAVGRCQESINQVQRAYALDPLSLSVNTEVGRVFYWCRQYDQAIEALNKAIDLDPYFARAHTRLGMVYAAKRDFRSAVREFEMARKLSGDEPYLDGLVAYAQASSGQTHIAREMLNELRARSRVQFVPAFSVALVCMGLKERDAAMDWLTRAYEDRSTYMVYAKSDPILDALRPDVRFSDLLKRMGLDNRSPSPPKGKSDWDSSLVIDRAATVSVARNSAN